MSGRLFGERTKCRSCQASIVWMETVNGASMPLDVKSEQRVVLVLDEDHLTLSDPGVFHADVLARARVVPTYTPHFATCPDAANWRKKR